MRFLIVGCGSMGKRRARCLRKMGVDAIAAVDAREDRLREIADQSQVETFGCFNAAFDAGADFVLLCLPPHLHRDALMTCIERGVPTFCEAPMVMTLAEADEVIAAAEGAGVSLAPSCTYLHNRIHQLVIERVRSGCLGAPLAAVSHVGHHVANWHPYEDYRAFYAGKRSEGGMAFDMLPHDLHLFMHCLGEVQSLMCMARRRANEIQSDPDAADVYDVLLDMDSGVSLVLHQDMFQVPWGNYRKIMCERGAVEWNWHGLRVCEVGEVPGPAPRWQDVPLEDYDFEDMYVMELEHALRALRGEEEYLMPPRRERRVLEIVLACEESSRAGREIRWDH